MMIFPVFVVAVGEAATSLAPYLPYTAALVAAGGFLWFCVRAVAFFAVLKVSVKTLTASVVRIEGDVKEAKSEVRIAVRDIRDQLAEHATDLAVINRMLDLDNKAQGIVRARLLASREERRESVRRSRDRVSEEVRDILEHQIENQREGEEEDAS